jgi:hypothetical protein
MVAKRYKRAIHAGSIAGYQYGALLVAALLGALRRSQGYCSEGIKEKPYCCDAWQEGGGFAGYGRSLALLRALRGSQRHRRQDTKMPRCLTSEALVETTY